MLTPLSMLVFGAAIAATHPVPTAGGTIEGVVVDGTHGDRPLVGVEVVLRVVEHGVPMPIDRTETDDRGRFAFSDLPTGPEIVYVAGANCGGVHYPGPRVRLRTSASTARVEVTAFDALSAPSPLVATRHNIDVRAQPQAWEVTETLVVNNPSRRTYVGRADADGSLVTLRLGIPANFDRVTFAEEFHGRRFKIVDHCVVTDIPWPPGQRKMRFSYRVPAGNGRRVYRRPLDLPCPNVRLTLLGGSTDEVSCSLPRAERPYRNVLVYESVGPTLPAGHMIELASGEPSIPWMEYGRWGALVALGALIVLTLVGPRVGRRWRRSEPHARRQRSHLKDHGRPSRRRRAA